MGRRAGGQLADGQTGERADGWTDRRTADGRADGWLMDGQTDWQADGQAGGRTAG
jgi:hypothetical protein